MQLLLVLRYQVTFANEESAWTRKRNADFLALQLRVQQADDPRVANMTARAIRYTHRA